MIIASPIFAPPDADLLAAFARTRSPDAFRTLADRHAPWVFAAAFRQLRDRHLAEDAAQAVFLLLAQKAHAMSEPQRQKLTGWLFNALHFTLQNMKRARLRQQKHESAAALPEIAPLSEQPSSTDLAALTATLDMAVAKLRESDRLAILLRFYQNRDYPDIARALQTTEPTARKRLTRAITRLRRLLGRSAITDASLSLLAAQGLSQMPSSFTTTITKTATLAAPTGGAIAFGGNLLMATTKTKIAASLIAAALLTSLAIPLVLSQNTAAPKSSTFTVSVGELAGRVVDDRGLPVQGATVSFPRHIPKRPDPIHPATTDANGIFRFAAFGQTSYTYMQIEKEGYAVQWITNLSIGKAVTYQLDKSTHITGTVLMPDKSPATDVTLTAITSKPNDRPENAGSFINDLQASFTTDAHGNFDIPLEPNTYDFRITGPDSLFARIPVTLAKGQTFNQPITLAPGIRVEILAIDTVTKKPIPNVNLSVQQRFPFMYLEVPDTRRKTDADGIAEWDALMPGKQHFNVRATGYGRWGSEQGVDIDEHNIDDITLDLTPSLPQVILQMEPAMHIKGTVVDSSDFPVVGMYVNINGFTTGDYRYAQKTNKQGEFELYVPATLVDSKKLCKLVVLDKLTEQPPHPLASSEEFSVTVGGEKTLTLKLDQ